MAETPQHRKNLTNLIETLDVWFAGDAQTYVSGNMFVYYVPGDRLRHVSPDVFVVRGVPKVVYPDRRRYLVWEEGKAPDLVIEITSASTREEDRDDKFQIYQDPLQVREYFLFDPFEEYLRPSLQGYRLHKGTYVRIKSVKGRLSSKILKLQLERDDWQLRLYDPSTGKRLPTPQEARDQAEAARQRAEAALDQAEAEIARLRRELEALRGQRPEGP
jgi:Uma2 family endonuclease